MERNLVIRINCGATHCFSAPGEHCAYLGSRKFGQLPVCRLFPSEDRTYLDLLEDASRRVLRCAPCLEAELRGHGDALLGALRRGGGR